MPDRTRWRFSANRSKDNERHAAGQRAEGQLHTGYLARLTQEQEERENKETRARFDESQRNNT